MPESPESPENTRPTESAQVTASAPTAPPNAPPARPPRSKQRGPWGLIAMLLLLCTALVVLALQAMDREHIYHCKGQEERRTDEANATVHHVPLNIVLRIDEDELDLKSYPRIRHNALNGDAPIQFSADRAQAHLEGSFERASGQLRYTETRADPTDKNAPPEHIEGSFQCQAK